MADPENKWSQPAAPPPPMFFGEKERDLVKQVNSELAERVIGQTIAYYPISIEESNFNDIYGEAIEKVSLPPVRVYAYVVVENEQSNERYGYEYQTKLTVNFHRKRLTDDQNLWVRVGDFVQYGDLFYEIVRTYNDTRYYFGQVQHKFQISAECIKAREGTFRVMPSVDRPADAALLPDDSTAAAPRTAPYPPVDASYITVGLNTRITNGRYLAAGTGVTLTDDGRLGALTIAATGQNAIGATGSVQFQTGGGSFSGSANLLFLTGSDTLSLTGDLSASANMSASAFYGDGSSLSGISTDPGVFTALNSSNIYTTSSVAIGGTTAPDHALAITGSLSASSNMSASAFYGDGSNLSGITTSPAGSTTEIQYNSAGSFAGSSNLTFNGTTLTGSYTGSLGELGTLSASYMNLGPISGTLAGGGSYLGLDANNNVILSAGDGATTSPAGSTTEVQFNNAGSFGASSNLTFNSTSNLLALTGTIAVSSSGDQVLFRVDGATEGPVLFVTGSGRMGLGTSTPSHLLTVAGASHLSGGVVHKRTAITNDYNVALTDYYLGVDTTSNTVDLTLPAASTATEGQTYVVKDEGGNAATNVITILRSASDTIDGTTSVEIGSAYAALSLYTDGSNWFIY